MRYSSRPVIQQNCLELRQAVNSWLGTPYLYGGNSQSGIDCSAFVQQIYYDVYQMNLPRTTSELYSNFKRLRDNRFVCGDLIFFKTQRGRGADHVGIYLDNNQFVHASTSQGVVISALSEDYYQDNFVGASRILKTD